MNAKELMIGDWVHSVLDESNIQILYSENLYAIMRYDDGIEPIPLTPEIFEKNGFMDIDTLGAEVCCGHDIYYKSGDGYGFNVVEIMRPFHYVHELQHALRLCGLNELADGFKV